MHDADATRTGIHAHADLPQGTLLGGRYRIAGVVGIGGMGVVYRAHDEVLGVDVALKQLRPELADREDVRERFRQELLLARQVSSPHVVRIHDLANVDGRWLISMDFIDGEGLDRRLARDGALPVEDALRIARQVAIGLAAAHARGVVHRDLKPANILLDTEGNAYISDFGVARSLGSGGGTRAGVVVGTPDYLAPEQARGEPSDARTDLYALGLVLHEMVSGELPFPSGTVAEVIAQRMLRTPPSLATVRSDLPAWVVRLVDRLLRPQPGQRLQTADAVVAALDARAMPRDLRGWLASARRPVLAVLLGAVALGGAWWWQARETVAPVATTAQAPKLDRLLVLPFTGSGSPARDAAWTAHLHEALASVPGRAVVGRERAALAMRRHAPSGQEAPDPLRVLRAASATRAVVPAWERAGAQWRVNAALLATGAPRIALAGPWAASPADALRNWLVAPEVRRALGVDPSAPARIVLPADAALEAYGEGLIAREAGRLPDAIAAQTRAVQASPGHLAAWLALAEAQAAVGDRGAAADALVQAQGAAAQAPATIQARVAAMRALAEGDPAAVQRWRAIVTATPDDADATLALARALADAGELEQASATLRALTARDPDEPRAWLEQGKLAIMRGQARVAVDDYLVRALVAFKRGRDPYGEAEAVNALGVGYGRLGQTADAIEQYRKAIELRRRVGNPRGEATSLRNLANVLSLTGEFGKAEEALRAARALNVTLGDRAGHAAIDNEIGLLAEERGDHRGALDAFRRALQAWRDAGDQHGAAEALNNIGFASFLLGQYGDAEVYWQQARDAYARLGDQNGRVRTMQNLALLAIARGQWDVARRLLDEALAQARQMQMVEELAVTRRNLADLELQQGHLGQSIEHARAAEEAFRGRDDNRGVTDAVLLQAEAALEQGDAPAARTLLQGIQALLRDASTEQQAIGAFLQARIAHAAGDAAQRERELQRARLLASSSGVRALQLRIDLLAAQGRRAPIAALDAPTAALGHVPLRLEWLAEAMREALARGDARAAMAHYDEALRRLRGGDVLHAEALHRLGADARRAGGDDVGARAALARAEEAAKARRER